MEHVEISRSTYGAHDALGEKPKRLVEHWFGRDQVRLPQSNALDVVQA